MINFVEIQNASGDGGYLMPEEVFKRHEKIIRETLDGVRQLRAEDFNKGSKNMPEATED